MKTWRLDIYFTAPSPNNIIGGRHYPFMWLANLAGEIICFMDNRAYGYEVTNGD